jgi:arylsulfatase A-like enzyme
MKVKHINYLGLCLILLLQLISFKANAQKEQKKNLLFIITDQQRYDALSISGNMVLKTPNLDRLAKNGAFFKNAYTPCAVCGPARSSILTGKTVENTGVNTNEKTYYYNNEVVMNSPTFDEILTDKGYSCEYYGKWHVISSHADIYKNPQKNDSKGKSVFGPSGQNLLYAEYLDKFFPKKELKKGEHLDELSKRAYIPNPLDINYGISFENINPKLNKDKHIQPDFHGMSLIPKEHSFTAFHAKQTIDAIERLKNKPFSITCSFHFPHAPMLPVKPYYEMYPSKDMVSPASIIDDMKNSPYQNANGRLEHPEYSDSEKIKYMISDYYGLIKEVDDWIGEILDKLEETGIAENTLIIFTSDHGEMLGAHGLREKNVFYEESAHIPLLINFPKEIKSNTKVDGYVSNVDLFATILDYLKVGEYPSDGSSLRGIIENTDKEKGKYVVTEWDYRGDTSPNYMIVKDGWKLIIPYTETSKVINVMYDLNTDPYEMNNLIGNNPQKEKFANKAEELRKDLLEWLQKNNSAHIEGVAKRKLI